MKRALKLDHKEGPSEDHEKGLNEDHERGINGDREEDRNGDHKKGLNGDHEQGLNGDREEALSGWVVGTLKGHRSCWIVSLCLLLAESFSQRRKSHSELEGAGVGVFERPEAVRHAARATNSRALLDHRVGDCGAEKVLDDYLG